MEFSVEKSLEILTRTPKVLRDLLDGLSDDWTMDNEGPDTWSAFDIMGHLIHGEKTDWTPRLQIILSELENKAFEPFDRFAQFENSKGKSLSDLLNEFEVLRKLNIDLLKSKQITSLDLVKTGIHPAFGAVTLAQLLSTWTVHDLNHLAQISRVMSKQYLHAVGPWKEYLGILNR